jgi:hypothetical protein
MGIARPGGATVIPSDALSLLGFMVHHHVCSIIYILGLYNCACWNRIWREEGGQERRMSSPHTSTALAWLDTSFQRED